MIWLLLAVAEPHLDAEIEACQAPDETPQLTLCLSERSFERADAQLNVQWAITYPHVKAMNGRKAARKLREAQRGWVKRAERECEAVAIPTPATQQQRNFLGCMVNMTDERTSELRAMVGNQ